MDNDQRAILLNNAEVKKRSAKANVAYDNAMKSLLEWLTQAVRNGYLTKEEANKHFKEEQERRENKIRDLET